MHHIDANETYWEKVRLELHKNAMYSLTQIQVITLHKTTAVQPLTFYFINHLWGMLLVNSEVYKLAFFFLSLFICYLLPVCWSCKGIKDGKEKDKETFKLNFYFQDLQLFCDTIYQPLCSGRIWHKVNF